MKYPKPQRRHLLFLVGTGIVMSSSILVSELRTSSSSREHAVAPQKDSRPIDARAVHTLCADLATENTHTFTTQTYRSKAYQNDSEWLIVHYKNAFTQGELACGSNRLSTALYGQKNMINRFVQELEQVEKKTGPNSNFDYIRTQAKKLKEDAAKRNMIQGQRLDCYGGEPAGMLCRPLTNIDGLEALFPELVAQVKARSNKGYTAQDIYDMNSGLTDGREFIDGTINLSFPLDHPQRGMPRWQQDLFKEFVRREFDNYDAQMYLSPLGQDPRFTKASENTLLPNGKTLYVAYKEWLRDYKKFPPYVSSLEKMRTTSTAPGAGGGNTVTTPPIITPRQNDPTTVVAPQPIRPGDPTKITTPNRTTIITLPSKKITPITDQPTTTNVPYLLPVTSPTTSSSGTSAGAVRTLKDSTETPTYKYQQEATTLPAAPSTRTLRY